MITISEIAKNSSLKKFPIICGLTGLENEVLKTGIIDYEFAIEGFIENNKPFEYGDFLISSLMFTNGDETALYLMVEKLIKLRVSGLAIKDVFFKTIPKEVIKLCNENSFPIIVFDNTVYFEEIINEIDHSLQVSDWINQHEAKIDILINQELSRYEIEIISRDMGIDKNNYAIAYYMNPKKLISHMSMKKTIKNYSKHPYRNPNNFLLKFKNSFIIIVTSNDSNLKKYEVDFNEILYLTGIRTDDFSIGISVIHNVISEIDLCFKEALWSCQVAEIISEERKKFSEIGSWNLVISNQNSKYLMRYMENYLNPILKDTSDLSKDLLETTVSYIKCEGNIKLTAKSLNIHENTLRYRLNKIREKLCPNVNDYVFYENTSLAIKVLLLNNQKIKKSLYFCE
jgi:sugar diacid utilization regulator